MSLQAILVLVLGFVAGFCFWANSFTTNYVHDQLVAQHITFPAATEIKAGGALDPAEFPASIRQYAGTALDSGDKAKEYANNFIGKHLESVGKDPVTGNVILDANGQPLTYSTMGDYITAQRTAGASAATIATLNGERDTMFKGEMLRGTLLNAWGWSQLGLYAGYAAWGLLAASLVCAAAFLFELGVMLTAGRRETEGVVVRPTTA
jgi:hypothetical protein